ncbi:phospholipase [Paraburkholderia sp. Se-20369]|nr:phospholipase [Paraburkholderia sp. Se-20369]
MSENTLGTQKPIDVAIDEAGRMAQGTVQWLLEGEQDPPITEGNDLEFYICGEEGFRQIAKDLRDAKQSVDIVCWGFDPGMELERSRPSDDGVSREHWPRGQTYGSLLEALAQRETDPVTVRLLVWYDPVASAKQNNVPGYSDIWHWNPKAALVRSGPLYASKARHEYCVNWWKRNVPHGKSGAGENPRLQVVLRSIEKAAVVRNLADEEDQPSETKAAGVEWVAGISEKSLLENYPTHHQKPILIDYDYEGGWKAVGYVMGLNSVTDYWDRCEHEIDDVLREQWSSASVKGEIKFETTTQTERSSNRYEHTKPYQDYACRIVGPALKRLHENFVVSWNKFAPADKAMTLLTELPPDVPTKEGDPSCRVQIVRTQPQEDEKSIKKLYYQACSYARNYIYIENQYFFYPAFVRRLKKERERFCDAWERVSGRPLADIPKLHLFIVIPHPEDDGMVPRTYETVSELGKGESMKNQEQRVEQGKYEQVYEGAAAGEKGNLVLDRESFKDLKDTLGLEVSIARLRTSGLDANGKMAYREIYIHSKLMLIDDVFVTLGSANLNQRSMAVDSEINIAATGGGWVVPLRKRIFELHSNEMISGCGERSTAPQVFEDWEGLMKGNALAKKNDEELQGFLLPFEDHRETSAMHAFMTIPAYGSTALS